MIAIVHLWRLLKWGRRLARSGGLRPFEDRRLPFAVRLLAKVARFGTGAPATPDFAAGLASVGPAAIKLGQALATRPDLIGLEAATDLARLQDAVPPAPFSTIEPILNGIYGGDWKTQFQSIEPEAIGAASIAQVHKGVTSDGRTVAIKLLRPGIEAEVSSALAILKHWAANLPACDRAPLLPPSRAGSKPSSICAAKPPMRRNWARSWPASPITLCPASIGSAPPGACW